jgi:molybdate transport system ATP-binding protein
VPQDARLFPHLDVGGNLRMGRRRAERAPGARLDPERVLELLELRGRDRDDIASLSGGERQRVALGRALCAGPDLLLLDEPLGALDQPLRRRILPYLVRVEREFGVPSILVSHDPTEVRLMCRDAIVLIDGRVAAHGRPDDILAGREMRARLGVAGHTNILRGTVLSIDGDVATVGGHRIASPAPPDIATGESVAVLVHAEELIVATESPLALSAQNILPGTVRAASGEPATAEGGKGEGSVTLAVDVAGLTTPLLAAVTAYSYRRLGLAASRLVFLVWKTHACRAVPAGSRSEENLA